MGNWGIYLARDDGWLARIALNDQPRSDARETLDGLRRMGYRLVMLSGDHSDQVEKPLKHLGWTNGRADARRRISSASSGFWRNGASG